MTTTHEQAVTAARQDKRRRGEAYHEAMHALDEAVIAALRAGESPADVAAWSHYDPNWVARLAEIHGIEVGSPRRCWPDPW